MDIDQPGTSTSGAGAAAEENTTEATSAFPRFPVELVQLYSDANIAEGKALPPPLPPHGNYLVFGQVKHVDDPILPNLEDQGIKRLFPAQYDRKAELKRLNLSILANFLDLLDIMIRCPSSTERQAKIHDIELVFINMHHLINEYRPHQARETLRLMMEFQNEERCRTIDSFQKFFEVVANKLRSCLADVPNEAELPEDLRAKLSQILAELPQPPNQGDSNDRTPGQDVKAEEESEAMNTD